MLDAPSSVLNNAGTPIELNHSGLTGGLNRMMRSPSPDGQEGQENGRSAYHDVSSPIKRTRRNGKESREPKETKETNGDGLGISIKNRAERFVSSMFGGSAVSGSSNGGTEVTSKALVRTRRGSSSSADDRALEVRKPKKSNREAENRKSKRKSSNPTDGDRPSRRQKQIDERRGSDRSHSHSPRRHHERDRQVTVYRHAKDAGDLALQREMAHHFLSLVSRDPERGCSIHKALKRFHRDLSDEHDADRGRDQGRSRADRERRIEDEKDLWRALRLRRNDRGEIVVSV
jgi:cell growth-regulating nucleolar protein